MARQTVGPGWAGRPGHPALFPEAEVQVFRDAHGRLVAHGGIFKREPAELRHLLGKFAGATVDLELTKVVLRRRTRWRLRQRPDLGRKADKTGEWS